MTHKFIVGQAVDFNKQYPWMSGGSYEVVSVLSADEDDSPLIASRAKPILSPEPRRKSTSSRSARRASDNPPPCGGPIFCLDCPGLPDRGDHLRGRNRLWLLASPGRGTFRDWEVLSARSAV